MAGGVAATEKDVEMEPRNRVTVAAGADDPCGFDVRWLHHVAFSYADANR
jgi:hypothetical protein